MKFNHDIVRELMLEIENSERITGLNEAELLSFARDNNITRDELIYTLIKMHEGGFITESIEPTTNGKVLWIPDEALTKQGHDFLDTIRDNKVWSAAKKKASSLKDVSLDILKQIASQVAIDLLTGN